MPPKVTFLMLVYNQERYIVESVRAALDQQYENLEIVISDDRSQDQTWALIEDLISEYRHNVGGHEVVLNRNDTNLGIMRNFERALSLSHGELIVTAAGDDVSSPLRVAKVVDAWLATGKKATVVSVMAQPIREDGRMFGCQFGGGTFGAVASYKTETLRLFSRTNEEAAQYSGEDAVYGDRAKLFGEPVTIHEPLVLYRVGTGVSTSGKYRLRIAARGNRSEIAKCKQLMSDLAELTGVLPTERLDRKRKEYAIQLEKETARLKLVMGDTLKERWQGYLAGGFKNEKITHRLVALMLLLPHPVFDFLIERIILMGSGVRAWRYRKAGKVSFFIVPGNAVEGKKKDQGA